MTQTSRKPTRAKGPTRAIGERVREVRRAQGLSQDQLAARCKKLGASEVDRSVIASLEAFRRERLTVEELLVLARALGVSPTHLLVPIDPDANVRDVGKPALVAREYYAWLATRAPLPGTDAPLFERARDEYVPHRSHYWSEREKQLHEARVKADELAYFFSAEYAQKYEDEWGDEED